MFYRRLGGGRTLRSFQNSLKNVRDGFDGHLGTGRTGWREPGTAGEQRPPQPLTGPAEVVLGQWEARPEAELWSAVRCHCDLAVRGISGQVLADLEGELDAEQPKYKVSTEGGRRAVVSVRVERDPSLRAEAIRLHGTRCKVCNFSFGERYGEWGEGFIIVHHLVMLGGSTGERETDPRADLTVLCANCHAMVHRRKGIALTVEELRGRLRPST
jgi:predicted HNH restriction endonuclease